MENKVFVTKHHVAEHNFSEIDFDLQEEFGFNYEKHESFVELESGHGNADGYPIQIDRLIEALENLKRLGSTHIEMNYHCDHIGYEISGYRMSPSTSDQIQSWQNEQTKIYETNQKIAELREEIHRLSNRN